MCVTIGRRTPAIDAIRDDHPATALTTCPASTGPRVVSTPMQRPPSIRIPVTSSP
jgi:hypothetical protein